MGTQTLHEFLTVEEVAELLRVAPRTVYDWVYRGIIPFHKAGRRTIFSRNEVLQWTQQSGLKDEADHGSTP